jgi:hypothetical protein
VSESFSGRRERNERMFVREAAVATAIEAI